MIKLGSHQSKVHKSASYLYKEDLLKLRLRNLATFSRARHNMGINATAMDIRSSNYSQPRGKAKIETVCHRNNTKVRKFKDQLVLTFEAKVWCPKSKAVNKIDKILGRDDGLEVNLQGLQVPSPWFLKQ